jgi:choline-sulfatase
MRRARVAPGGLALLALLFPACSRLSRSPAHPSLLLVSIDTLRADHVGAYGRREAQTPRLDALAARGARFEQASTVAPLTLPAHSSLLTGTFPAHHGVRDNGGFYLGEEQTTLAEVLGARGYRTGGFVGAFVLDGRWGLSQGFERYADDFDLGRYEGASMDAIQRRGDEVVDRALAWLAEDRAREFFAWVHLYDPHAPYQAPEPFASRFAADAAGAYDAEIAWTDTQVGRLLDALAADGRLERTVVVVVGDHGESLGEHGEPTHGFFIYEAVAHVPLIVAGPGVPARVVAAPVRIVDVMPTALALLGAVVPAGVQGTSLVPLVRGDGAPGAAADREAIAESWYPRYHYGWSELVSLRDGRYKLIQAPRPELYDLAADPGETRDLAAGEPQRVSAMARALRDLRARLGGSSPAREPSAVDPEVQERLEALGYVSGPVSARNLDDRPRGDPKDKIGLYNRMKEAGGDAMGGRVEEAIAKVRSVVAEDPEVVEAYALLGNFQSKAHRDEEAVRAYKDALAHDPGHQGAVFGLALAYKSLGRMADAEAGFERARQLDPRLPRPLWQLADIRMQKGDHDGAIALLQKALTLKGDTPAYLLKLGECYLEARRYDEAERTLQDALRRRPDLRAAHYDLALVHEGRGDTTRAIAEYEQEIAAHDDAYRAAFNLGRLLLKAGRPEEAARRLGQALAARPDLAVARLYLAKALFDTGHLAEAEQAARAGLAGKPDRETAPLGHYVLADIYARQGRARDAAREAAAAERAAGGR